MQRTKLQDLREWVANPRRKPLVVWGARQVGKTYLVKELFAKESFADFVYIDLKKDAQTCEFFSTTCDPARYLSYIEAHFGQKVSSATPLILDEVQQCHQAITSLKYFKQDYQDLPVIATGSMVRLSIRHAEMPQPGGKGNVGQDEFLFPVGGFNSVNLFPLTFDEYLLNSNPVILERIQEAYRSCQPLEAYEHEAALDALYTYLSVGGMPEPLDAFLHTGSYIDAKDALREVYENYLADMDTYNVSTETILKTRRLYRSIYAQLSKENKNFKITQVEAGKSNRDYFNAYQWLELARVTLRSSKKEGKLSLPLLEEEKGLFRLYLSDPGLFTYQSGIAQSDFMVKGRRNTLAGVFYESYVADELVAKGIPLFYWEGKGAHEFEFLVEYQGTVLPIDVKKGKGKMNSLAEFRLSNPHSTAIKIHAGNFGYDAEQDILSIPLYAAFALANTLAHQEELPC